MFKKTIAIILLFVMSFLLIGCKKDPVDAKVPDAPKNAVISEENVSWDSAKHATGYIVVVNGDEYFVEATTFSLKGIYMEDGQYEIYVKSVNGKVQSEGVSGTVNYAVDRSIQRDEVFLKLLKLSDESYKPGMDEEDFTYWWEYSDYQSALEESEILAAPLVAAGIGSEDLDTMIKSMDNIEEIDMDESGALVLLKTEFDIFRNMDVTPNQLSYLLVSYATSMLENEIASYEEDQYIDNEEYRMLVMVQEVLVEEKQAFVNGVRSAINYMYGFYDGVEATMLSSMESIMQNEVFNAAEFIILKNEIVAMLNDTVPTIQDFENMYSILGIISGKYLELEKTDWDSLVQGSAIMSKNAITVELLFLSSIDATTVNELKAIIDQIDLDNMNESMITSMPIYSLGVYIVEYIDNFYEVNKVVIDALPEMDEENIKIEVYNILKKFVLKVMEQEFDEEDLAYYSTYVERFFDNIDDFEAALDLMCEKGENGFNYFIENNGIILEYVFTLYSDEELALDKTTIIAILNQILEFNSLTFGDHQKSDVVTILNGLKIPMELYLKEMFELERTFDASVEVNALIPHMATILSNIISLENQLMVYLDEQNVVESILAIHNFALDTEVTEEELIKIAEVLIKELSVFFTEEREALVISIITVLSDDINSRQIFLDNNEMTLEELAEEKDELISEFNSFIDDLDKMAEYNFKELTPEQKEEILDLFDILNSKQYDDDFYY